MGVRGLKSFLEREGQTRPIDVGDEVNEWKRHHCGEAPTIVIDFLSIANCVVKNEADSICGGRHQIALNSWNQILDAFKATGCSLVFFSDSGVQKGKIDEWLMRQNDDFIIYSKLYDSMRDKTLSTILAESKDRKALPSTFYGMAVMARTYGDFHYSTKYECDLEVAQYAKLHNAIAVISNDTDFLIFDGLWRLWSSQEINTTPQNRLETIEFNRYGIGTIFSLSTHQLPLFATLMGNDFTGIYYEELYHSFGPYRYRIRNIARYVQEVGRPKLTDDDIGRIVHQIFGTVNDELQKLIRKSIDSYDTNFPPAIVDDPIESKLLHTNMYHPLMGNKSSIHGIPMPFYDMRGCPMEVNLPKLLIDRVKRRKAVIHQDTANSSPHTFTSMAKKDVNEDFMAHTETIAHPDFPIPPLDELYGFYFGSNPTAEIIESQWKVFGWIMSFSDDIVSIIRQLPREYMLISGTLYALVQNGLVDIKAADGILYTENRVLNNDLTEVEYPVFVVAEYIRAAHIYNIAFSSVRQNFAIVGLLRFIQEVLQFDGVYFQKLMETVDTMNDTEYEQFIAPIQQYRIYAASK